ncbi:MAG: DUF4199 domain-containing protein [Opitutaceae bacterium]
MKTPLTYGFLMAIAGAVLVISLYLLGYHSDASKFGTAQMIGMVGGLAIGITCITLGMKARRAEIPAHEPFGYGRALGTGVMIALFASLFGIVTNFAYVKFINPGISDMIAQTEIAKLEAKRLSGAQLEGAEKMIRVMTGPLAYTVMGFLGGLLFGTLISLVVAAFLKRPAAADGPPVIS